MLMLLPGLAGCGYLPFGPKADTSDAVTSERPRIKVTIEGIGGAARRNIHAHVSLATKPCDTAPAYLHALKDRAHGEALDALRAFGYYQATVKVTLDSGADGCPAGLIGVEPGPRVHLRRISLAIEGEAQHDDGFGTGLAAQPLKAEAALRHGDYEASKRLIEQLALERGYLNGRFLRSELRVDPAAGIADVDIVYDSGPRFRIGEVRIQRETAVMDEELIRRFLEYEPGAPYDASIVARFYAALSASEYFETVEVRPLVSAPEGQSIPIEITLTPRKQHKYTVGLGASTDEGIRSRANYLNRRVNSHGHRFKTELRASLIEQRLSAEYQIPRAHPGNEWLSLQGGLRRQNFDTYDTVEAQIGVSETRRRRWGWMETHFLNLSQQSFKIGDDSQATTLLIPGLRWNKTTADDPIYPSRGYALDFELRGAPEILFSDVTFARALLSASTVYGLPAGLRVLLRGDAGYSWTDDFDRLPPSERFFAGGDVSIRGFDFESLGPENDAGDVIGGRYLGVASFELEKSITDTWGVATFVDAGNAFGGSGHATGIRVGVGLGLRWRSPVGPARIDLAHPLDDDTVLRLHLRIGPDL